MDTTPKTLNDLFMDELSDMYDAEHRLVKALPNLAKAATCNHLKAAILAHLKETEGHVTKIEQVFALFGAKPTAKTCEATVGLLKEGDEIAAEFKGSPAINAALISAAQKVEHYEIASYGCLHEWAGLLGNHKAADLIDEILDEEKAADDALTELARAGGKNQEALAGAASNGAPARAESKGKAATNGAPANGAPSRASEKKTGVLAAAGHPK